MSNKNPDKGNVSWWKGISGIIISWWKGISERIIQYIMNKIREYRDNTINPIVKNKNYTDEVKKEQLEEELRTVRFSYNVWNGFASGFIISFFVGFITLLAGKFLPENIKNDIGLCAIAGIFIFIVVVQAIFLGTANTYYEKMEIVKAELEKINNLAQSNPEKINNPAQSNLEKISIRIYKRNLASRSFFGR